MGSLCRSGSISIIIISIILPALHKDPIVYRTIVSKFIQYKTIIKLSIADHLATGTINSM